MPSSCCVPGCRSNYTSNSPSVTVFKFPKNEELKRKWLSAIPRADFTPKTRSVVCLKHFDERFVIREDTVTRPDGSVLTVKRDSLKLTKDAFPTIFENLPSYLSRELPPPRKDPAKRKDEIQCREKEKKLLEEVQNTITGFTDLRGNWDKKFKCDDTYTKFYNNSVIIFKICTDERNMPKVDVSLVLNQDLEFKIFKNDILINENPNVKNIIQGIKIDKWSKLKNICTFLFSTSSEMITISVEDNLETINHLIDSIEDKVRDEEVTDKLEFCREQIKLALSKKISYCAAILTWFASIFFAFPGAYKKIRQSSFLTMPHPAYLQTFTSKMGTGNSGIDSSHWQYLRKKLTFLDERQRICNLLLDEVYVKPELTYKSGKLEGVALKDDSSEIRLATTVQSFMISSIVKKSKDVVGLFPCKDLTAEQLQKLTLEVLKMLTDIGYRVLCLISDNNSVNRKMYGILCNGSISSSFKNPFDTTQNVFLLFDSVHLFKCIRNNWLNQVDYNQTFEFPDFKEPNHDVKLYASLGYLKKLHKDEENNVVKLAPCLSKKVLYPTSIERQNVSLCCKLFDEKNIAALKQQGINMKSDVYHGTVIFMDIISRLWRILNVKHAFKGDRLHDTNSDAIFSVNDENCMFLRHLLVWLKKWDSMNTQREDTKFKKRYGKLSNETQFALYHTVQTLLLVIEFLKKELKFHYVLLGKFQTDDLEARFGQYREMSGSCYHISVKQILESERKLKALTVLTAYSAQLTNVPINDVSLSQFMSCDISNKSSVSYSDIKMFEEDLNLDIDEVDINDNNTVGIVYIGGYIAKEVSKYILCDSCKKLLVNESMTSSNILPKSSNPYFNSIDRGGLKYPSDFVLNVLIVTFKTFNLLISERYESTYLNCKSQRDVLIKISTNAINDLLFEKCCQCDNSTEIFVSKVIHIFGNILLNNYRKMVTDKMNLSKNSQTKKCKKRKLDKLS